MQMLARRPHIVLLFMLAALVASGCGGDDATTTDANSVRTVTETVAADAAPVEAEVATQPASAPATAAPSGGGGSTMFNGVTPVPGTALEGTVDGPKDLWHANLSLTGSLESVTAAYTKQLKGLGYTIADVDTGRVEDQEYRELNARIDGPENSSGNKTTLATVDVTVTAPGASSPGYVLITGSDYRP